MLSDYAGWLRAVWVHPGNRGHRLRSVLAALHWFIRQRFTADPLYIRVFGGLKFACYRDNYMGKHVRYFSEYADYDALHFIHDFLRPGDQVIDVGANAGLYTLLAASVVGESGRVLAVEPQPRCLEILRHNLALNVLPQVTVLPVAATDNDGTVGMTDQDVFAGVAYGKDKKEEVQVAAYRLDRYLGNSLHAFCKIDIEGYEWPAMKGMEQAIQRGHLPIILFEMNGCLERYGFDAKEFYQWLRARGYTLANYRHDERHLRLSQHPTGDVFAITATGFSMLQKRMADLNTVEESE